MKVLHILRSEPDEMVNMFIEELSKGEEAVRFPLYTGDVEYEKLLQQIFECDKVVSWW